MDLLSRQPKHDVRFCFSNLAAGSGIPGLNLSSASKCTSLSPVSRVTTCRALPDVYIYMPRTALTPHGAPLSNHLVHTLEVFPPNVLRCPGHLTTRCPQKSQPIPSVR
ncbi:hypothetical protein FKM82_001332 [Ascaphus truei]